MRVFLFVVFLAIVYGQENGQFNSINSAYHYSGGRSLVPSYVLENGVYREQAQAQPQPQSQFTSSSVVPQQQPQFYKSQQAQPQPQYNVNASPSLLNQSPNENSASMVGAVYFMTNDPRGNVIVSTSILPGGALGSSSSFPTAGTGGYNTPHKKPPGSPDPLASQNSLLVGSGTSTLFAVNAGSNSISMFAINPTTPTELTLLSHVASGGEFPVAMAYSPTLRMLCVLNAGTQNGVQCFTTRSGSLQLLPEAARPLGLTSSTPSRELGSVSDIIFTPDSSQLLVSVKGNPDPVVKGFIASFRVQGDKITNVEYGIPHEGSVTPWGMSIVPGTGIRTDPMVVFTDPFGKGFGLATIRSTGTIAAANMIEIPGQEETCWAAFSPRSQSLFTTDSSTNLVTESQIDVASHGARILNQYPLAAGSAIIDVRIASLKDRDMLYVLSSGDQSVQAMELGGPGQAVLRQQYFPVTAGNSRINLNTGLQGLATYVM